MRYQLYQDENTLKVWGNEEGAMVSGVSGPGNQAVLLAVHGEVPPQPQVETGTYTDTVIVTLHY